MPHRVNNRIILKPTGDITTHVDIFYVGSVLRHHFNRGIWLSLLDSPHNEPAMWSVGVYWPVNLNKLLEKNSSCLWLDTLWRSCDVIVAQVKRHCVPSNNLWVRWMSIGDVPLDDVDSFIESNFWVRSFYVTVFLCTKSRKSRCMEGSRRCKRYLI